MKIYFTNKKDKRKEGDVLKMQENKFKYGFSIIIVLITIMYFFNTTAGIDNKLIVVNYLEVFLIFIAWVISIVKTIREKDKMKIIPCVIITVLCIIAFASKTTVLFSKIPISLLAEIGLAIFLYEIMDLLNIEWNFNIINVITISICSFFIAVFLFNQITFINRYKNSLKDISNFLTSSDLTYKKLSTEFETLVIDKTTWDDEYNKSVEQRIFMTPAYIYKGVYCWAIMSLKSVAMSPIKNQQTFIKYREELKKQTDWTMTSVETLEKVTHKMILESISIMILETVMVFVVGIKNKYLVCWKD